jgi:actin-related protein 2
MGIMSLSFPIEDGYIKKFDDMEKLWNHLIYKQLRVSPEEFHVLITEPEL